MIHPQSQASPNPAGLWVFAYGSLLWNPGFSFTHAAPALLRGYHRQFCIYSDHYRGTPECPGLVLGLDRGGSCRGLAYHVAPEHAIAAEAYLRERELRGAVYFPRRLSVLTPSGTVNALTFVVDRASPSYARDLGGPEAARIIARSIGANGRNSDYLHNTVAHLRALGIHDAGLEKLAALVPL